MSVSDNRGMVNRAAKDFTPKRDPDPSEFPPANKKLLITAFPWIVLFVSWAAFFLMDQKMDAPMTSLDERVVSDIAQQVSDGDVLHKILTVVLGMMGAVLLFKNRRRTRINAWFAGLFIAYLGWICLGVLTADDPGLTIRRLGGYMLSLLLCAGCALGMDVDSNSFFVAAIPTLNVIPDIVAELKSHGLLALTPDGRWGGTYPHPNVAAAAISISILVYIWFAIRTKGMVRVLYSSLALMMTTFFLLTRSRTSIVAVLAALAFSVAIFIIRHQRANLARLFSITILLISVTGLAGLIVNTTPAGLNVLNALRSSRDEGDPTTLTGRVDLWKNVLGYASERPVMGFGFGGFWSAKRIETISEEQQWPINQSHSAYIDQVLGLGYPGAALYVFILFGGIVVCAVKFFRGDDGYGVWAALLVFIAVNSFTEAISLPPGYLSFVVSLMTIQIALVKQKPDTRNVMPDFGQGSPVRQQMAAKVHTYLNEEELQRALASKRRPIL